MAELEGRCHRRQRKLPSARQHQQHRSGVERHRRTNLSLRRLRQRPIHEQSESTSGNAGLHDLRRRRHHSRTRNVTSVVFRCRGCSDDCRPIRPSQESVRGSGLVDVGVSEGRLQSNDLDRVREADRRSRVRPRSVAGGRWVGVALRRHGVRGGRQVRRSEGHDRGAPS